jgi:hypothetical protein
MALAGFLLITNLRVNRTVTVTSDTAGLVAEREQLVTKLSGQINTLSEQINTLKDLTSASTTANDTDDAGSGTVLPAIEGPGVTVTLDDSPLWEQQVDQSGSSATINDYVVHQQDIEAWSMRSGPVAPSPCRFRTNECCPPPLCAAWAMCCSSRERNTLRPTRSPPSGPH